MVVTATEECYCYTVMSCADLQGGGGSVGVGWGVPDPLAKFKFP